MAGELETLYPGKPLSVVNRASFYAMDELISPRINHPDRPAVYFSRPARCGAHILDPLPYLCDGQNCYGSRDGWPLYVDDDHLIEIGSNVRFSSGKIYLVDTRGQHIRIGADTTVEGAYLLVDEAASIDIGRDSMLSTDIIMPAGDKHSILDLETGERLNPSMGIRIADRVWVGRDVQILKGVVLRPETEVATRSLVCRAFEEGNCVVAGVPAGGRWDRSKL